MPASGTDAPGGGHQDGDDGLVPVFLTTAVRTSAGPGPGVRRVPPQEAGRLVGMRHAVYGETPPRYYDDGAVTGNVGNMLPR